MGLCVCVFVFISDNNTNNIYIYIYIIYYYFMHSRFFPAMRKARDMLRKGEIGTAHYEQCRSLVYYLLRNNII